jgi:hypothetical protein
MSNDDPVERFGCSRCWPASARDAWAAKKSSALESVLIEESHYIVSIWRCDSCGQRFLNVTTEMIDWVAGEDPIHRTLIPLTPAEVAALTHAAPPSEHAINAIGIGRRSLGYDWPSNQAPIEYWRTGILVGPHH